MDAQEFISALLDYLQVSGFCLGRDDPILAFMRYWMRPSFIPPPGHYLPRARSELLGMQKMTWRRDKRYFCKIISYKRLFLDLVEIRGIALILPLPALLGEERGLLQLLEGPLDVGAGETQVPPNGLDGWPALARLVGPVPESQVDQLGPGGQVLLVNGTVQSNLPQNVLRN